MERLVPINIKTCRRCVESFNKKSGYDKVLKTEFLIDFYCDWCLGKTFTVLSLNPYVCVKCSSKLGHRHQMYGRQVKQMRINNMIRRGY